MESEPVVTPSPYVRSIRPQELSKVADLCSRALHNDPLLNWSQRLTSSLTAWDPSSHPSNEARARHALLLAMLRTAYLIGFVEVVIVPSSNSGQETVVAVAAWLPPDKRLKGSDLMTLLRGGFVGAGLKLGWRRLKRVRSALGPKMERHANTHCIAHGLTSYRGTWSLQSICTEPGEEGKGYMSLLMGSRLVQKPAAPQLAEATTPEARAYLEHFGFEMVKATWFGGGSVSNDGLPAVGARAVGVPVWVLAKWV